MTDWWQRPRRPKLDARNEEELRHYSTDDLRRRYQDTAGGDSTPVRLRDGIIRRDELVAVIRWRDWWEGFRYFTLLTVSVIAMIAAVIAAVEGWR